MSSPKHGSKGVWDERTKSYIKPSGTVKQGRRPMFQPFPEHDHLIAGEKERCCCSEPAAPQPANAAPVGCEAQPKPWGDLSPLRKRLAAAHQQSAVLDKLLSALKDVREELGRLHLEAPSWKRWEAKADAAIAAAERSAQS